MLGLNGPLLFVVSYFLCLINNDHIHNRTPLKNITLTITNPENNRHNHAESNNMANVQTEWHIWE